MSTTALTLPVVSRAQQLPGIFLRETRYEFIRAMRTKAFSLSVIGFPVMFYVLFAVMNRGESMHGEVIAKYLLASYSAFGVVGAALFGIGVGLAGERTSGWLELKRASPMPPLAYLGAKCVAAMAFGLIITTILCIVGTLGAGVHLSVAGVHPDLRRQRNRRNSLCLHGTAAGHAAACKLCAWNCEPHLSADELLRRPVGSNLSSAEMGAAHRSVATDLSSRSTVAAGDWLCTAARRDAACFRTRGVHAFIPRRSVDCIRSI